MTNAEKYKPAAERAKAHKAFCDKRECIDCPCNITKDDETERRDEHTILKGWRLCAFKWLELEVEEEKIEDKKIAPCPFCPGETHINLGHLMEGVVHYWVDCISPECMYRSAHYTDRSSAIAAHNRVARAVKAAKEGAE